MDLENLERGQLQNLQNQETDFDQAAMWKNIEQSKKKRRPFIWLWLGSGAGFVLVFLGLFFYNNTLENNAKSLQTDIMESQPISAPETPSILTKSENSAIVSIAPIEEFPQKQTIAISSKNDLLPKQTKENYALATKSKNTNNEQVTPLYLDENLTQHKNIKYIEFPNINPEKTQDDIRFSVKKADKKTLTTLLDQTPTISLDVLDFPERKIDIPIILPIKKPTLTIGVFAGIGYQFKQLSPVDGDVVPEIIKIRNKSESVLESLSFGMEIDKNIGEKWRVGTGVEMMVHNEKIVIENQTISNLADVDSRNIPSAYIDIEGFLLRRQTSIYYNQYQLINLPVRVSYLLSFKKIRLLPELGMVFNLHQKSRGVFRTALAPTKEVSSYIKNRIGMRFGCKVLIPTRRKFSFYLRPSFNWTSNQVQSENIPIRQKRNVIRLDLGISRSLF